MKFAVWLRGVIDALMRTPYLKALEAQLVHERELAEERLHDLGEQFVAVEAERAERIKLLELKMLQARQDLTERIRDKEAVIADLKVRLSIAEADVLRRTMTREPIRSKPVPDFGGVKPWQDELAEMGKDLEVAEGQKETNDEV